MIQSKLQNFYLHLIETRINKKGKAAVILLSKQMVVDSEH